MIKFIKSVFIMIAITLSTSQAIAMPDQFVAKCALTPQVFNDKTQPKVMGVTNNLIRKTGSILQAEGKVIYISGRLLDKKCVPISDAKVEMWQANAHGIYQYEFLTRNKDHKFNKALIDPNFVGSGVFRTNNLGQFNFITVMPGKNGNNSPSFNLRITSDDFEEFETKIYFSDVKHDDDVALQSISASLRKSLIAELTGNQDESGAKSYYVNITLPVVNKYRRF